MPIGSEVELRKVEKVPGNDDDPAGGTGTTDPIDGASNQQLLPSLAAQEAGTLDVDIERQYQGADLHNLAEDDSTLVNAYFFAWGTLKTPTVADKLRLQTDNAADGATKKRRNWGKIGGALLFEDIILNGLTQVAGAQNFAEVYRSRTLLSSNDNPTTLAGKLTLSSGSSGPGEELGQVPVGWDWATGGEMEFGWMATASPTAEWDTRRDDPGVTYSRPRSLATAIICPVVIPAGGRGRLVCRHTLQPALPAVDTIRHKLGYGGDSGF